MLTARRVAVVNARLVAQPESVPRSTAFLAENGVITEVGSLTEVLTRAGDADVIDCAGAAVVPGFVDGHCHFEITCVTTDGWVPVHTPPYRSLSEVAEQIRASLDRPRGDWDWLLCRSSFAMNEKVEEQRLFSREELDAICSDRPLAVFASLHVASLNTAGFHRLGLWEPDSIHPFHGVVHRDSAGVPTGVVTEIFMTVPPPVTPEGFDHAVITHGRDMFNAAGTTTVHTMPENLHQVEQLRTLHQANVMSLRQRYYLISPGVATLDEADELARIDATSDSFRFGGIKVFVNGCAHDGLGVPLDDPKWTQESLNSFVRDADSRGFQVWLHSLNSRGVRMAAEAIYLSTPDGSNPRRHRIEHGGDFIDLDDLPAVRDSGALLVTTPQFLHSMTADPSGPRAPLRTLLAAGIRLVGGTDSTGTVPSSVSILGNVDTAVARQRRDGSTFHPQEALDVRDALALFTSGSAFGGFSEGVAGCIAPGSFADFALLTDDPLAPNAPPAGEIEVLATYVGGARVWQGS